ncbi:hypothetical protein MIMGU_mgv1a021308mg [Erythranthe guttata]|uniref:DUF4408 domain-containing protein n=1 Tax=Erythranthe guttata TaxID=4155 RepID=A0A022QUB7_ERYGU|nr:PREDICTED: uncharacterized protein LOC105965000 [Erythranthe guttata]EYU31189.1 hypothetical protein MIMGU_mgv1a021308mg [Erythranthe guttata]|eukprot:XP_012844959.1 PREDICTED: uncharacterized protein LOC105965000 [Erythranthe guttata]
MEGFDYYNDNNVKKEEKYAGLIGGGGGVGEIKKLLRVVEICLVLVSVTWAASRLPFAVRISGEYFRWLVNVVVSHLFVFLLGNAIILILFFKSRHLFLQQDSNIITQSQIAVFCHEFIDNSDAGAGDDAGMSRPEEIVVYQDKQTILEVVRVHRRSQSSENLRVSDAGGCEKQLRRSETEKQRKVVVEETAAAEENVEVVDELSNEEFQRAIDAFIAKQIKFRQQEKLAIVPHHGACL